MERAVFLREVKSRRPTFYGAEMQKTCYYCNVVLVKYMQSNPKHRNIQVPKNGETRDHIEPLRIRGKGTKVNTVPCCVECNQDKGRLTLEEFKAVVAFRKGLIQVHNFKFPGEE